MSMDNYTKLKKAVDTYPLEIKEKIICYHAGAWNEDSLIIEHGQKIIFLFLNHPDLLHSQHEFHNL